MQRWLLVGISGGFLAVALGAFGAHALKDRLDQNSLSIFKTATEYLMFHSLALIGLGIWATTSSEGSPPRAASLVGGLFSAGIVLFSGSLYALALTGIRKLGMITPLGGLSFLCGWIAWGVTVWRGAGSR